MRYFVLAFVLLAGCRTQPADYGYVQYGEGGLLDLQYPPDLVAPPDLSVPTDFYVPVDFRRPVDFAPDLTVPAVDLALPLVCRNVYVVDTNNLFSNFDTDTLQFHDIATLKCPSNSSPNSMAISRDGFAWVAYSDGNLFKVDITTGACVATNFVPSQLGFATFGMGFAADTPTGTAETLYVASTTAMSTLAVIAMPSLVMSPVAQITGNPELTGTRDAQLWGFFPDAMAPMISQIDKKTGVMSNQIPLPNLAGSPSAWAFAFWGGSFWVFLQRAGDNSTWVYEVDRMTGNEKVAIKETGRRIVGAGVSSCAPTM